MPDITPSVGVLVYRKNNEEILLVKHGKAASHLNDICGLPAGKLEEKESEIEAAVRELSEETGLVTNKEHLNPLPKLYFGEIKRKEDTRTFSFRVFICKSWSGKLRKTDETEPFWTKIHDLDKYNLLPNVKQAVLDGLEYLTK